MTDGVPSPPGPGLGPRCSPGLVMDPGPLRIATGGVSIVGPVSPSRPCTARCWPTPWTRRPADADALTSGPPDLRHEKTVTSTCPRGHHGALQPTSTGHQTRPRPSVHPSAPHTPPAESEAAGATQNLLLPPRGGHRRPTDPVPPAATPASPLGRAPQSSPGLWPVSRGAAALPRLPRTQLRAPSPTT